MKYEIKSYIAITILLVGFVGFVTDPTSRLALASATTGDEQILVLWGTPNMDLSNVLIQLVEISQELQ